VADNADPWAKPTFTKIADTDDFQITRAVSPGSDETIYTCSIHGDATLGTFWNISTFIGKEVQLNDAEEDNGIWVFEFVRTP
jgi:hypothetical protein